MLTRSLALSDNNDFDRYAHKDAKELIKRIYEKRYEPYDWSDFSKWYITAQVKTLMLRFALNQRDIDLFKKGCAIQFEGDTLPSPEIFKWVRQHHAKHQAIQFVEVEQRYVLKHLWKQSGCYHCMLTFAPKQPIRPGIIVSHTAATV